MVTITYETEDETNQTFAHVSSDSGVFGHVNELKAIPKGTWITIPPSLQPTITKYLVKKCGFSYITSYPIDGVEHDVLVKE